MVDPHVDPYEFFKRETNARRCIAIYRRIMVKLNLGSWDDLSYTSYKAFHELEDKLSEVFKRRSAKREGPPGCK